MSEKNRDNKNRWRNVTIAFHMSPEENEELNNRVKLSGFRTKQDYIIQSVLYQKVVAAGNPLMLVQFRQNLQRIEQELERIEKASDMDGELLTPIRSMLEILEGFKEQLRTLSDMKQLTVPNEEWYIYCNGRLVVAADKTSLTTWKDIENKNSGVVFTNTYASFQGTVSFSSNKPEELPWNTTKTGIDESSLVYLQAKEKMIDIFKIVKGFIDEIRKNTKENDDGVAETVANMPSIELTTKNIEKVLPENRKLSIKDVKVKTVPNVVIRYKKPKEDVELLKRSLGVTSNNEVGELTFDYYKDAEC